MTRSPNERGTVTAFVTGMTVALLAVGGLVIDGGYLLAERQQAFDEADAAARAGAQAVDVATLRAGGPVTIDLRGAQARVDEYMAHTGHRATVRVEGDQVVVDISYDQPLVLLDALGVGPVTIESVGRATAVQAVEDEDVDP